VSTLVWGVSASKFAPARRHRSLTAHSGLTPTSIPLSLIVVLPVISSAVFFSVGSSLITVGFGSSERLLSRGFLFRYDEGGY
jgi:hypothetical protein